MQKARTMKREKTKAPHEGAQSRSTPAPLQAPARARKRDATRAAILQAALQVFAERGYAGSSTRDIADRVGTNHALIKYYFQSKEMLWREAVRFLFRRQDEALRIVPRPGLLNTTAGRRQYAREVLRAYILYCARYPEHAQLMMQESLRDSERLRWLTDTFGQHTARGGSLLVELLQREKMVPPDISPVALLYIIVGAAQLFFMLAPEARLVWTIEPTEDSVINAHVEALLAVLIRD